jgi:hypothetical protein
VPKTHLDKFAAVTDWRRRRYLAMVNYMDDAVVRNNAFLEPISIYQHRLRTSTAETEENEGVFCRRAWWAR